MFSRCHDTNKNIPNFNIQRGRSGVAIIGKTVFLIKITKLDAGNERVITKEVNLDIKLCIINVYMSSNKSNSEFGYRECLDVIHDVIQRCDSSHTIVLCGDLNGTLLTTRKNKHDKMLKDFVNEHHLSTGNDYQISPTFYHFNGYVTSQIDYILCSDPSKNEGKDQESIQSSTTPDPRYQSKLLKDYTILERQAENHYQETSFIKSISGDPKMRKGLLFAKKEFYFCEKDFIMAKTIYYQALEIVLSPGSFRELNI